MKKHTNRITIFIGLALCIQATLGNAQQKKRGFVAHTIDSKYLKEQRRIYVKLPRDYQALGKTQYPVIYVLGSRKLMMKIIQETDSLHQIQQLPKIIVVGIPHKNAQTRKRDLTPDFLKQDLKVASASLGQASNFLDFLGQEAIPLINAQYTANPRRLLVGHSREGLFVINTLMKQPTLFTGYLALSPALWRENNLFVTRFKIYLQNTPLPSSFLFMSMGSQEVKKMTQAFDQLTHILKKYSPQKFTWKSSYTPDANHQTNHLRSVRQGILLFFKK